MASPNSSLFVFSDAGEAERLSGPLLISETTVEAARLCVAEAGRPNEDCDSLLEAASVLKQHGLDLQRKLETDSLTGVLSREAFLQKVEEDLRQGTPIAIVYIDLDGFKGVNDKHGHIYGDSILARVAQRFKSRLRRDDSVAIIDSGPDESDAEAELARLSGDEFCVRLVLSKESDDSPRINGKQERVPITDRAEATYAANTVVERLEAGMEELVEEDPDLKAVGLGASMAFVLSEPGDTVETLLDRGDKAMYQKKRKRRAVPAGTKS